MNIQAAIAKYLEQCHCGHTYGEHTFDTNEDSIVCDECECAGFDADPPEPGDFCEAEADQ